MERFDVLVIGGGPGGYVAAIRCAQLGLKTACVDAWTRNGKGSLGGTCLNVGCIPSKALLDSSERYEQLLHEYVHHGIEVRGEVTLDLARMLGRKDAVVEKLTGGIQFLFKKNKVTSFHGKGRFVAREGDAWRVDAAGTEVLATHVIVATGSVPRSLPLAPFDGVKVVDNEGALSFPAVPQRLGVIGAGVIGLELGSVWRRLGAQVTVLEAAPTFLAAADEAIAREAQREFTKQGLKLHLGITLQAVDASGPGVLVRYRDGDADQVLEVDRLIVSVGRVPFTQGLGAEAVGLALDGRGFVAIDAHWRTNLPNVWAVGDVVGGAMLAHKAEDEGVAVAETIAGQAGHVNYQAMPWVIYTSPEIAWVGRTEQDLKAAGVPVKAGRFPFAVNGRALGHGDPRGFVKVLAHAETDEILGVHMIGANVSELLAEAVALMEFRASAEDLARTTHGHPTLSEVVKEAALAAIGRPLHA
ncbi:MAG: dihydrolipoyl dehydrogenase [Candidatus Sericytochromatia bacterium]|nr:dihydrolipoyl dehydrogenase [Candidatus Sericytochromatia bacterium]